MTNSLIFEPELVCADCGGSMPRTDEPMSGDCQDPSHGRFTARSYRHLRPRAELAGPITLRRLDHALVSIPQRYVVHSPTGFEWGYGGSGPAELALNILALFVEPPEAWRLHQQYKWDVIAKLPREGAVIQAEDVIGWIRRQWENGGAS